MNSHQSDVSRAMSMIASRWKVVAAVTAITLIAAFAYISMGGKLYETTARVGYQAPRNAQAETANAFPDTGMSDKDIQTLVGYASAGKVISAAAKQANVTPEMVRGSAKVSPNGASNIINFRVRASDPKVAAKIANAYASALIEDRMSIARPLIDEQIKGTKVALAAVPLKNDGGAGGLLRAKLQDLQGQRGALLQSMELSEAEVPATPVWPSPMVAMFAAMFIGIGLGCGIALVTASFDRKLTGDMIDSLPAPVVVRVPQQVLAPKGTPLSPAAAEPLVIDAFAALGARVMLDHKGDAAHIVLMASARSGEGKSTVAANLASALARSGRRVILVDADMRKPTQDTIFPALQAKVGLSNILRDQASVEQALTLIAPNLAAIGSGPPQTDASVLLASLAFRTMLDRLANISDAVIIDAPPVLPVTDSLAIVPAAHRVLFCARVGTSSVTEIAEAHAKLAAASSTPQSIVLVGTEAPTGYGYGQGEMSAATMAAPPPPIAMPPNSDARGVA